MYLVLFADDFAADETELVDDVSPSHDDDDDDDDDGGGGSGGGGGGATAAALQANPGGIFLPQSHPNYSQFLKKHINSPSRSLHFPSDSFTKFLPSDGHRLSREAAGLQTYVPSDHPPSDQSWTKHQGDVLAELSAIHDFDVSIFANLRIPEDALSFLLQWLLKCGTCLMCEFVLVVSTVMEIFSLLLMLLLILLLRLLLTNLMLATF